MRSHSKHHFGARKIMHGEDVAVAAAATVAVTQPWWGQVLSAIPDFAQGLIVCATVVYVVARAANEVRKFWFPRDKDSQ